MVSPPTKLPSTTHHNDGMGIFVWFPCSRLVLPLTPIHLPAEIRSEAPEHKYFLRLKVWPTVRFEQKLLGQAIAEIGFGISLREKDKNIKCSYV